jgi:hypothetical protein
MSRRTSLLVELPHVDEVELPDGRRLTPGVEFSIHGGGRFRFRYGYRPDGSITAHGPIDHAKAKLRSFKPEQVKTIHRSATEVRT